MQKLLIDCDTGIDDSLALLFALKRKDVRVVGIVSVFGNTSAAQAAENSARIVRLANPGYSVPIAVGSPRPLDGRTPTFPAHIHGANGLGNVDLPAGAPVSDEDGVGFLIRTVRENPGEITLVTLGPLTNLALALKKEPALPKLVRRVVCMGGTLNSPGNVLPMSEANIANDAEAAALVVSAGLPLTLVGLDVTGKTHLTERHLRWLSENCGEDCRPISDYISAAMHNVYFPFSRENSFCLDGCPVHDPLAMLAAIDPTPFLFRRLKLQVECCGSLSRGRLTADLRRNGFDAPFTDIAVGVDSETAVAMVLSVFCGGTP